MVESNATLLSGTPVSTIEVVQTIPTRITMHTIEDHQLTLLTNVSRPLTLAVTGILVGAFFSLLPGAVTAISHLNTKEFSTADMIYVSIDVLAFFGSLYFGTLAVRGEFEARKLVQDIRGRQQRPF